MPEPLTTYIANWQACYLNFWSEFNNLYNDCYNLGTQLAAEGNPNSSQSAFNMAVHILNFRNYYASGSTTLYGRMFKTMDWIDTNWPSGAAEYDLTLEKMLTAIWESDSLRWFHFINYIDSMRAGIWNLEIYDTHLAEWYRHFSTTG